MSDLNDKLRRLLHESAEIAGAKGPGGIESKCESPIEELMLNALWSRGVWQERLAFDHVGSVDYLATVSSDRILPICAPQAKIGNYRIDFLCVMSLPFEPTFSLAVECDGHDFHEKTKEQAARDKSRDRDLVDAGLTVMRFTGSEIWRDPGACADQVINLLWRKWYDTTERLRDRVMSEKQPDTPRPRAYKEDLT